MKIREILRKYLVPGALVGIGTGQWVIFRFGPDNPSVLQQELQRVRADSAAARVSKANELAETVKELEGHQSPDTILKARSCSLVESNQRVTDLTDKVDEISTKLQDRGLSDFVRKDPHRVSEYKVRELTRATKEDTKEVNEFAAKVQGGAIESPPATSSSNVGGSVSETTTNTVESSTVLESTNVKESSLFSYLIDMKELVSKELANLSSEQLCCFTNLMGFIMIFGGLFSITTILLGQYLIDYFNLEDRYPKLVKFLKLRQTIDKYYLIINIILIYLIIIYYIVLNFYMLLSFVT